MPGCKLLDILIEAEKKELLSSPSGEGVPYNGLAQRHRPLLSSSSDGAIRDRPLTPQ